MRVGILSLMHESNTFATGRTPLSAFERDRLLAGPAVRDALAGTHHEVGGFLDQLDADRVEAVPVFAAWTMPSGTIEAAAATTLVDRMTAAVRAAGPLDAYLLAPHGAAVAESEADFDGFWMTRVRELVGSSVPVIGTLDLHCNLSPRMVSATSALVSYRLNPHTDQRDRGREAASLLVRTLRGDIRPTTAAAFPPLVVNIEAQATAESPCRDLLAVADDVRGRPKVLSVSLNLGFPYSDVRELGASAIVVTDGKPLLARQYADELAGWWWGHCEQFRGRLVSPAAAVARAATADAPVCLLDMGDNVGGGSPADGTVLVRELMARRVGPSFACLNDPEVAEHCHRIGVGAVAPMIIGGKTDDRHGQPIPGTFTVRGLFAGTFEETEARHGGLRHYNQGPTAVVDDGHGLTLMLTSRRTAPFSLRQVTAHGLDPRQFRVLVAKGVHAPIAAYSPVCRTLIRVNTPGVTSADLSRFTFRHRRVPLFPFETPAQDA